jgi:hypothetical protein
MIAGFPSPSQKPVKNRKITLKKIFKKSRKKNPIKTRKKLARFYYMTIRLRYITAGLRYMTARFRHMTARFH